MTLAWPFILRVPQGKCTHPSFVVGCPEATLRCGACAAPLDPWWVRRFAALAEEVNQGLADGRAEVKRLKAEIAALKANPVAR